MWLGNYVITKHNYSIKISSSKFQSLREKMMFGPLFGLHFFLKTVIFYTAFIILHDKHNRQVMLKVKRLILPIENES